MALGTMDGPGYDGMRYAVPDAADMPAYGGAAAGRPGYDGAASGAYGAGCDAAPGAYGMGYGAQPAASAPRSELLEKIGRALDGVSGPLQRIADRALGSHPADPSPDLPLKWFTFNIMFLLWVEAIFGALGGITTVMGQQYGGLTDLYYAFAGPARALDIAYGLVQVALAAATVYVRMELAQYRRFAPVHYLALVVISFVFSTVYSIVLTYGIGLDLGGFMLIPTLISAALNFLFLYLNKKYYDRRAYLFYR